MSNWFRRKGQNEGRWERDPSVIVDVSRRQPREPAKFARTAIQLLAERVERENQERMQTPEFWREVWGLSS